jgi:hypothetical protein
MAVPKLRHQRLGELVTAQKRERWMASNPIKIPNRFISSE